MSQVIDCADEHALADGIEEASTHLAAGNLIVLPTDTVYGIACDPFNSEGVNALFRAKGRGRSMPPPVLIPNADTTAGLALEMPSYARRLIEQYWPGPLTIIVRAQPSLMWDIGETNGTIALRVPDDEIAQKILLRTGPLAVTSANQTGKDAASTVLEASLAFGPAVATYFDDGSRVASAASTIIDCTKADPEILRSGVLPNDELKEFLHPLEVAVPADALPELPDAVLDSADDELGAGGSAGELSGQDVILPPGIDPDSEEASMFLTHNYLAQAELPHLDPIRSLETAPTTSDLLDSSFNPEPDPPSTSERSSK